MFGKLLIIILFISLSSCKSSKNDTSLTILGTVHFPTKEINADSIYHVLSRVQPDFILMEADSSIFNIDFSFKKTFDENEYNAIVKYKKDNPEVKVRPIEFEGRDEYRKSNGLYSDAGGAFKKLNQLSKEGLFDADEEKIWNRFGYFWSLSDSTNSANLKTLNSPSTDGIIDSLMQYQYVKVREIVNNRDEFEDSIIDAKGDSITIRDYFNKWADFEYDKRNNALSNNILSFVKDNPGKKIIVLTGYYHRFYILEEIGQQMKKHTIELKEFYEF